MNVAQHLEQSTHHVPDKPAIIFGDHTMTYRELSVAVDRTARGLAAGGVATGDRVALFLPNTPEFAIAYLAALKLGAIAVSLNVMLTTEELAYVLTDSGATLLFTSGSLLPQVRPLVGATLAPEHVVVCEGEAGGFTTLARFGIDVPDPFTARDLEPDAPAAILYTSGTTGRQKGAVLSHRNVVSNATATAHALPIHPTDRLLLFLPLFHCFGQNFILNAALTSGATVVLQRRFEPEACLEAIERQGVTMFFAVPTIYIALLNANVPPNRLASIRYFFSAAATMPVEVAAAWQARFGRPIHEGYGLTETSPFASYNHVKIYRPGSIGTPIECVEMRVVDGDDLEVSPGTWGEIVIRGPNIMLGYWRRPEETASALRGGWFHTGDIGYADEDGYFYLVDRVKDMINTAGFKIWPREVEEVLYRHPGVKECAVVGVADPLYGEVARAFVIAQSNTALTEAEVAAFCREHLAAYMVPRSVAFVDSLPKSTTGKILKRVLREQAARQEVSA